MSTLRIPTEIKHLNSIVLYGTVASAPETRRTPDNANEIASFLIQFPAPKPEDPPFRIKVTAWNKLAETAMEFTKDSQVIIEGRLKLDTVDRGTYKEKRTELIASKIHVIAVSQPTNYTESIKTPVAAIAPQASQTTGAEYNDIPF